MSCDNCPAEQASMEAIICGVKHRLCDECGGKLQCDELPCVPIVERITERKAAMKGLEPEYQFLGQLVDDVSEDEVEQIVDRFRARGERLRDGADKADENMVKALQSYIQQSIEAHTVQAMMQVMAKMIMGEASREEIQQAINAANLCLGLNSLRDAE